MTVEGGPEKPLLAFNAFGRGTVIDPIDDPLLGNALIHLDKIPALIRVALDETAHDQRFSGISYASFEEIPLFLSFADLDPFRHAIEIEKRLADLFL
jgi:hypothetical protein